MLFELGIISICKSLDYNVYTFKLLKKENRLKLTDR